jgi:hypothetical protein
MSQLVGQTGDRITAESQAGLPQLNTQLRDLQTLSQRQLASYAQNTLNNDINANGVTRTAQEGNQAFITRQYGIDSLITNANISAISGQIQTAQAQVDRAMSLKYDPIKQVIENQKFILDQLNTKEARAASNVKDLQLKQLEQQQNEEKAIQNIGLKLAEYGQDQRRSLRYFTNGERPWPSSCPGSVDVRDGRRPVHANYGRSQQGELSVHLRSC